MAEYTPVPHSEEDEQTAHRPQKSSFSTLVLPSRVAGIATTPVVAAGATAVLAAGCFFILYVVLSGLATKGLAPLGEEINRLVPEFQRVPRVFWNDSSFGPEIDVAKLSMTERQKILDNWERLIPEGEGFLPIDDPMHAKLPPPLQKESPTEPYYYAVSVFHQVHCLHSILRSYLHSHGGLPAQGSGHAGGEDVAHAMHCFDYLRQSIMCCGDTALEGADPYTIARGRDTLAFGTFGVGSTHVCKDYDAIFAYARKHANPRWVAPS